MLCCLGFVFSLPHYRRKQPSASSHQPADDLKYFYLLMRLPCQARHIGRRRLQPFAIHFFCRIFLPNSHITVFMKITFHQRLTLRSDTWSVRVKPYIRALLWHFFVLWRVLAIVHILLYNVVYLAGARYMLWLNPYQTPVRLRNQTEFSAIWVVIKNVIKER